MDNPQQYFASSDPRVEKNWEQLLVEILLTAIAAVLSGAESRNDRKKYGKACFPVGYRRDGDGGDVCTVLRRYLMETLPRRWLSMAANSSIAADRRSASWERGNRISITWEPFVSRTTNMLSNGATRRSTRENQRNSSWCRPMVNARSD